MLDTSDGSYDSESDCDRRLHRWETGKLAKFAGVYVDMKPRWRKRKGPTCPVCHQVVRQCPYLPVPAMPIGHAGAREKGCGRADRD